MSTIDIIYGASKSSKWGMLMKSSTYLPITILPTKMFQENKHTIYMSSTLQSYWKIKSTDTIHLCIGTRVVSVLVNIKEMEKDHILFTEDLMTELSLPIKKFYFMSQFEKAKNALYVGPILALVTEVQEQENGEPSFQSIHSFCEELHYACNLFGGFFYVTHIKDVSLDKVKGWYYEEDGWKKSTITHPNVIYNRIHSRRLEASPFFYKFKNIITLKDIPMFNEGFLTKWEAHNILHAEQHLQPFLPETDLLSKKSLSSFLEKYKSVYLKPINGSQGRNIFRVSQKSDVILVESSTSKEKTREFHLLKAFMEWFETRAHPLTFIIQQTIPLVTYQERQLDFRVLCHKDSQNNWRITSLVSRVSAANQLVSNLAKGGEMLKPAQPLVEIFDRQTVQVQIAFMRELSLEVANLISQSSLGFVGELGIDMGIDHHGNPWIIEVNSKPSKNAEEQKSKIRPSAKAIFEYAYTLAFHHLRNL